MGQFEDRIAQAEHRIREADTRAARQAAVVEALDKSGHERAAEKAREALSILRTGIALARLCLIVELAWPDDGSDGPSRYDA